MKKIFACLAIFAATVLFLSIEIGNKPIFAHIYKAISPATKAAQNATENFFNSSVDNTQKYSQKLFDNSVPRVKDSVKSKASSLKREVVAPAEKITPKEREELDDLIKSHR